MPFERDVPCRSRGQTGLGSLGSTMRELRVEDALLYLDQVSYSITSNVEVTRGSLRMSLSYSKSIDDVHGEILRQRSGVLGSVCLTFCKYCSTVPGKAHCLAIIGKDFFYFARYLPQ